jgi:hypothetical protein
MRERSFAGGKEFVLPTGTLHTPNITPDKQTGIGTWTKEAFVRKQPVIPLLTNLISH